ncbi:MAG: hypothetical protein GX548_00380 [Lentisphaerae bacterium]|nr:hypothetical protein [Lentisphaerota bacterium]
MILRQMLAILLLLGLPAWAKDVTYRLTVGFPENFMEEWRVHHGIP